jgi:hypothetical protein
LPEASIQS